MKTIQNLSKPFNNLKNRPLMTSLPLPRPPAPGSQVPQARSGRFYAQTRCTHEVDFTHERPTWLWCVRFASKVIAHSAHYNPTYNLT